MTARKTRPAPVPIPALPKAVAYPPDSIWRNWEAGESTLFRGNLFKREGQRVIRVIDDPSAPRDR
jgi:hypothetical protein